MKTKTKQKVAPAQRLPGTYGELVYSFEGKLKAEGSKSVANKSSAVRRWLEFRGKVENSPVDDDLGTKFHELLPEFVASLQARFGKDTVAARKSQIAKLREHWLSLRRGSAGKDELVAELKRLIHKSGRSAWDLRRRTGINFSNYLSMGWRPSLASAERLERYFGVPVGTITRFCPQLPPRPKRAWSTASPAREDDGPMVSERYRLRHGSPELEEELNALYRFKTAVVPPDGMNRVGVWRVEKTASGTVCPTAERFFEVIRSVLGWLHHRRGWTLESCRLGVLTDASHWEGCAAFLSERRGKVTQTVAALFHAAKQLNHPEEGFLSQTFAVVAGGLHLDLGRPETWARFFTQSDDSEGGCAEAAALAPRARLRRWCALNYEQLKRSLKHLMSSGAVVTGRVPTRRIEGILKLPNPIAALVDLVEKISETASQVGDPYRQFAAARDALMIGLDSVTCLRSKQLRQLSYPGPGRGGSGWLQHGGEGSWTLFAPTRGFKNWRQVEARYGKEKPISYQLPACLTPLIEAYLRMREQIISRARLSTPGAADLLFLTCSD